MEVGKSAHSAINIPRIPLAIELTAPVVTAVAKLAVDCHPTVFQLPLRWLKSEARLSKLTTKFCAFSQWLKFFVSRPIGSSLSSLQQLTCALSLAPHEFTFVDFTNFRDVYHPPQPMRHTPAELADVVRAILTIKSASLQAHRFQHTKCRSTAQMHRTIVCTTASADVPPNGRHLIVGVAFRIAVILLPVGHGPFFLLLRLS